VQSFVEAGHYDGISTGKNTTATKKYYYFSSTHKISIRLTTTFRTR
jgi:hypothetical protein